ncbi:DUF6406 domain-containing protein [Actinoallomurus vinaceus]|uniref:DUF6406 domain-containing protein n=1 Tax=Actinoallomurus vinaceus TaxID=1080074 RepID=UPI003CD057FA
MLRGCSYVAVPPGSADEEYRYTLSVGDIFPARDQTWKLATVENAGRKDWVVVLSPVGRREEHALSCERIGQGPLGLRHVRYCRRNPRW